MFLKSNKKIYFKSHAEVSTLLALDTTLFLTINYTTLLYYYFTITTLTILLYY